jgi:hypothetical protein
MTCLFENPIKFHFKGIPQQIDVNLVLDEKFGEYVNTGGGTGEQQPLKTSTDD